MRTRTDIIKALKRCQALDNSLIVDAIEMLEEDARRLDWLNEQLIDKNAEIQRLQFLDAFE